MCDEAYVFGVYSSRVSSHHPDELRQRPSPPRLAAASERPCGSASAGTPCNSKSVSDLPDDAQFTCSCCLIRTQTHKYSVER